MLFKDITIIDENIEVRQHMYVGVKGDTIAYVGEEMPEEDFGEVYEGRNKLLMSGFYNAHGHSPMALMRGYGENMVLQDWLNQRIFPFEDQLTNAAVYWGTTLSMAESLKFGIVSTSDMYYFMDDMVKAYADAGAKGNICRSIVQFDNSDPWLMPSMQEVKRTFEAYHNTENGRIKMDCSIHAEYTSNPGTVRALVDYSREVNTLMQIHISETQFEHEECKKKYGKTPVQYFNDLGAWDLGGVAAHCVWIEGEDFDILKEKKITAAANPVSNLKLASGVSNVPKMLKMGINVAIGTDSVASNNSLNFIEEMKVFATSSKMYYKDPTAVTPKETIYAATRAGALGQGREDCGLLKQGFKADLIVMDLSQPHMHPVYNLLSNIVYSASGSDVVLTMVDGKVLYRDGQFLTIDMERAIAMTDECICDILTRV